MTVNVTYQLRRGDLNRVLYDFRTDHKAIVTDSQDAGVRHPDAGWLMPFAPDSAHTERGFHKCGGSNVRLNRVNYPLAQFTMRHANNPPF
jgi:hypothetical protein